MNGDWRRRVADGIQSSVDLGITRRRRDDASRVDVTRVTTGALVGVRIRPGLTKRGMVPGVAITLVMVVAMRVRAVRFVAVTGMRTVVHRRVSTDLVNRAIVHAERVLHPAQEEKYRQQDRGGAFRQHASRHRQSMTKFIIMPMSSCSRLWQCIRNSPR